MCAISLLKYKHSSGSDVACAGFICIRVVDSFVGGVVNRGASIVTDNFSNSFIAVTYRGRGRLFGGVVLMGPPDLARLGRVPGEGSHLLGTTLRVPVFKALICRVVMSHSGVGGLFVRGVCCGPFRISGRVTSTCCRTTRGNKCCAEFLCSDLTTGCVGVGVYRTLGTLSGDVCVIRNRARPGKGTIASSCYTSGPTVRISILGRAGRLPRIRTPRTFLRRIGVFFWTLCLDRGRSAD